jgi:hypothetical protein
MPGIVALAMAALHVFYLFDPASAPGRSSSWNSPANRRRSSYPPMARASYFSNYLDKWSWAEFHGAAPTPLPTLTGLVYGWTADGPRPA